MDSRVLHFGEIRIELARGEITRAGTPVPVEPQVLDLIVHLASNPGRVVSRDEIIDAVWQGRIVSDSAISSRINAARTALGDDGSAQKVIRTVPRRGYLFVPEVAAAETATPAPAEEALPDKPSIAVLPFQNMSGDPEQAYFSDGITDDIITDLSRYGELFVIARHSSFAYRDPSTPTREIAGELGVRYIAEGSVRRAGNRVRVTARLIDPRAGNELWAERFDRDLTDIFAVQDEITAVIVNTLAGQIARQHYLRVLAKDAGATDAYDHALKAAEHAWRVSPEDNLLAREEAAKAVAIDPRLARAHAILALSYINEGNNFWVEDPAGSFRSAHRAAADAVAADPRDPWAHAMLGVAELWQHRGAERALVSMRRALELNPGNAHFRGLHAYVLAYAGQPETALEELEIAARENPQQPAVFDGFHCRALLLLGRIDEALPYAERVAAAMPGHSNALGFLAVGYAAAGRLDEARETVARLCEANPFYRLATARRFLPYERPADLEFMTGMLARAGLPE
ncbi:MAG: winged helix-turn-helix domain-containing tetratricopeptide repeat protein [Paracoccaceae bacterium]|nr:winged helix-turn-helix domain-containing tetratricopeptide repeat protein [Paracoccaceae bacterium]